MASETLEQYQKAYVDYKTVLQIDCGIQLANDSINRICTCSLAPHLSVEMYLLFLLRRMDVSMSLLHICVIYPLIDTHLG